MERLTHNYAQFLEQRFASGVLAELQEYPHFVTWVMTEQGKKLPIDPKTGKASSSTDPNTWGSIDQALIALKSNRYTGIGYVFSENDPYSGVDIDKCVSNNQLTPEAKKLVTELSSYTELSPSHTGLHILVKGSVPTGRRKDNIEMYSTGRYFTLTTNRLKTAPRSIEERQPQLDVIYASLTKNKESQETFKPQEHQIYVSDEKVLEKAENAKNGDGFKSLYAGNIERFESKSEADFELVLRLIYWSNDDIQQVERLFRQSALYDEKTDRQTKGSTYLEVTIANALKKRQKR